MLLILHNFNSTGSYSLVSFAGLHPSFFRLLYSAKKSCRVEPGNEASYSQWHMYLLYFIA